MAVDDLHSLRTHLPDLFKDATPPPSWEEDWIFLPIDHPESLSPTEAEAFFGESPNGFATGAPLQAGFSRLPWPQAVSIPRSRRDAEHPGSLVLDDGSGFYPPPDAFAFYLPFHYFHPTWWGIYLLLEPTWELAMFLSAETDGAITPLESHSMVRIFLYAHESFHHQLEVFATRLEISHRVPLYRTAFQKLFDETFGQDNCYEEALATAFAYRKVKSKAFPKQTKKRTAALKALEVYIKGCPPGYSRALDLIKTTAFDRTRLEFAEQNHMHALPKIQGADPSIWLSSPQAFRGISNVKSRVNYLVRRDSPLAKRQQLHLRYLRYRELAQKLRTIAHCEPTGEGKGSHEKWRNPQGQSFPVPKHPGDLRTGTLKAIIKQAGLQMSISEFLGA